MKIKVAIVEDDKEMGNDLKSMIESSDDLYCCGVFEDAESFIDKFKHLDVDVVLMDIELPGLSGSECVGQLKVLRPKVEFLMCTHLVDDDKVFPALRNGAIGYLVKNTTAEELVGAVKLTYAGQSPISPRIARKVIDQFLEDAKTVERVNNLSAKEKETLDLLAKGHSYKIIADKLSISIETVRSRIRDTYRKLHVNNKTDAINKIYPRY